MAQRKPLKPAIVLIVEHECIVRLELEARLVDMGMTVLVANDADQAIALLDAHPEIELLLTDFRMPGSMDGVRLAHHVHERWPPVKIIVTSGLEQDRLSELPQGGGFLAKPYGAESLWEALAGQMIEGGPGLAGGAAAQARA